MSLDMECPIRLEKQVELILEKTMAKANSKMSSRNHREHLILFFLYLSLFNVCTAHPPRVCQEPKLYPNLYFNACTENVSNQFVTNEIDLSNLSYEQILNLGKAIIPTLINNIESDSLVISLQGVDPMISDLRPYTTQSGVKWAYAIELILHKTSPVPKVNENGSLTDNKHTRDSTRYVLYRFGIIGKKDDASKSVNNPYCYLTHQDMIEIQQMYRDWWEKNKMLSLEQMRDEYNKGEGILKYPYFWM